jgi:hypothetical protein
MTAILYFHKQAEIIRMCTKQLSHVSLDVSNCQTREWTCEPAASTCAALCGDCEGCADSCCRRSRRRGGRLTEQLSIWVHMLAGEPALCWLGPTYAVPVPGVCKSSDGLSGRTW